MCEDIDTCLTDLYSNYNTAIAISRKRVMNSPNYSSEKIYCFGHKENVKSVPIIFLMRSHYELLPRIDRYLRILMESGLIVKWERDNDAKQRNYFKYDRIVLNHFIGPFATWIIGLNVSILVFVFELVVKCIRQKCTQRRTKKMVSFCEKLFTARRF